MTLMQRIVPSTWIRSSASESPDRRPAVARQECRELADAKERLANLERNPPRRLKVVTSHR
jgi:hypothetical protein